MKVSMSQAAKMVGIQRSTFYRHIEEKGISLIKEEGSHPRVDVSELIRVYGGDKVKMPQKKSDTKRDTKLSDETKTDGLSSKIKIVELEIELKNQQKTELNLNEQIEYLKDQLDDEKSERKKAHAMLTDQRSKPDGDEKGDAWQKSLSALEKRISNQEHVSKEEKEKALKIQRQNIALKKALNSERNKSFWSRLFG